MVFKKHDRQYDLVVFGATGYTGALTAEHISASFPSNLRWAIAGRSEAKLRGVVEECKKLNSDREQPYIEICNLDAGELAALAKKAFVLINTVGPYAKYGEPTFKACAENGTHYLDVTGEVPYVAKMLAKYEDAAKASGAMMFPQIGIESAPPDLITWAVAQSIRQKMSAKTGDVTVSIHELKSVPSGGTLATALEITSLFSVDELRKSMAPYAISPIANSKKAPSEPLLTKLIGVREVPELGTLTTSIAAQTDAAIVHRSWGLHATIPSRKEQEYGPNFTFTELYRARNWLHGIAIHIGLIIGLLVIASPLRYMVQKFVYQPGQGPDKEQAKRDYIEYRATGVPDVQHKSDQIAMGRAWFHGSMYYLSGVLIAQAALTILEDDLELPGGVLTASCLGQKYIDRLSDAGFKLEVKMLNR